jgi:hypothetical protein
MRLDKFIIRITTNSIHGFFSMMNTIENTAVFEGLILAVIGVQMLLI